MVNGRTKLGALSDVSCALSRFASSSFIGAALQKYAESCLINIDDILPCVSTAKPANFGIKPNFAATKFGGT